MYDVSKAYILYRNKQDKERENETQYKYLSKEFLSKYKHMQSPMTEIGNLVFYRTYSRYLTDKKRREYWWETVARAVDYNCSLQKTTTRKEAEDLYDNMFNLRQFLSGRTLWSGGTKTAYTNPISQYNCSGLVIDNFENYKDMCYLLMLGCGVGLNVQKEYINKLPKVRGDVTVNHLSYKPLKKQARKEVSEFNISGNVMEIIVGDSKTGWASAIDILLKVFYSIDFATVSHVMVNYNSIRPHGEPLKTFGGTASGHEALLKILEKIYIVLKQNNDGLKKLKPIEAMDIANIIAEGIVVGGVRRSALMTFFDADDNETMNAKSNLYTQGIDGEWIVNEDILHRMMSNNSVAYEKKPSFEELKGRFVMIRHSAEGNFYNLETARKRKTNCKISNPCLRGDMKLLTPNGYVEIEKLVGENVEIINKDGIISNGKVWKTGDKPTVKITVSDKEIICTKDHRFMLTDGNECEAEMLKGKRIMPSLIEPMVFDEEFVKYGFIQGDGMLRRLDSADHKGLEVCIGMNDVEVATLFDVEHTEDYHHYIVGFNDRLRELGFSRSRTFDRELPSTFENWTEQQKISFIRGCYSANGSIIKAGRVSYKTTSKIFAEQLLRYLSSVGYAPYMTTNKPRNTKFSNGEYTCKESYDVNLCQYSSIKKFYEEIGFLQSYKNKDLKDILIKKSPIVKSVKETGLIETVYDFSEPLTNWGVVEGYITHNCGEILLDSQQFCNLTTVNMMAFVKDEKLDLESLLYAQKLSARAGYRVATLELELPKWNEMQSRDRLIGCSFTGWQDMVNATNMSFEEQKELARKMRQVARKSADDYADSLGLNRSELVTSVKPEGSLSQLPTVSSGLHFSHSPYYIRRIRINSADPLVKVCEELGYPIYPEVGQDIKTCKTKVIEFPVKAPEGKTKYSVSAIEQLEIYKMFMEEYVDHNASNTISVRDDEWDGVIEWIYNNWESVIGVTFISLDNSFYQLMPYDSCTKEEYEERKSKMSPFNPELLLKYENVSDDELLDDECTTGACPIR